MKLEKYVDKSVKRRKVILISISVILLISVSLLLYKTFASFTESVEFPMMNGKVDYFGNSDIYFVFYKQGELVEEMPLKDNVDNIGFDHAKCDNEASIIWNEEEWAPLVKNLKYVKTKCSLYFEKMKYYVSTNGNDEANGNKETPLKTIQEAYNRIVTRGTIILLSNVEESNGLTFNSEGKEVTITSEDGTYEIDRGSSLTSKPIIELTNKNNLTLTNVIFNGKEISSTRALIEVNNSSLTINKGTIIENGDDTASGGGIKTLNDSRLIINGGEIKNNQANYGGGIELYQKIYFEMNGGNIINNIGTTNGAGIHIDTSGKNGSIINIKEGLISKNISQNSGAGIAVSKNSGEIEINITGGTISENEAAKNGGGMYLSNGTKTTLNISGGIIENNKANYGGGIYLHSEKEGESINKITTATIRGNNAISGGGIYIQSNVQNATYEIDGAIIDGNVATKPENSDGGVGGGIRFNGKDTTHVLTLSNVNIINNEARYGGGIYSSGKVTLNSGKIEKNSAITYGGGIDLYDNTYFEMNGGNIINNTAENGGGVCIEPLNIAGSIFNFNGGEISNNTATGGGGGLKHDKNSKETTLNLKGTNFIGNTAGTYGGGIDIENKNPLHFELSGGLISENTATNNTGGGLFISANSDNNTYNITGGTISNNTSSKSVGGGMRVWLGSSNNIFNISNVIISENIAGTRGGGIFINYDENTTTGNVVNLKSGEIKNNKSSTEAGGIFAGNLKEFNMSGGNITNNTCTSGTGTGGLYIENTVITYNKTGGTISDNIPSDVGGIATK